MKKIFLALIIIAAFFVVSGCRQNRSTARQDGKINVTVTIFPAYDFVRQVAGDKVNLSMLLQPGAESHSFEPTARDMISISEADLFIHVGGVKDEWVAAVIASVPSENLRVVPLIDIAGELLALTQTECDDDCDHDDDEEHPHDEFDVHVWTCPRQVIAIVENLTEILCEMDETNANFYRENAASFVAELRELDENFLDVVENAARNIVVFGDRFPFRYFVETYDLTAIAAFDKCCVDTSVAPGTVSSIITLVENRKIPVVFHIELSNKLVANIIEEATGAKLSELHSAHNISGADFNAGVTYLDLMRRNIENLREALN